MQATDPALRTRVRELIAGTGLTQAEFAAEVHLDPDKLSKSLTGVRRFTTYEIAVIAEHGHTTVDWLLSGTGPERITLAARAQQRGADSGLDAALGRAREIEGVNEILQRLRLVPAELPVLPNVAGTGRAVTDGPRLAEAVLAEIAKEQSLGEFRADPARALEDVLGIHVVVEPFGADFDGLAWATKVFRLAIVNSEIPWTRQRFTLLHEVGHIVAGDGGNREACVDGDVMGAADQLEEMRANAFAAAALMPEADLRAEVDPAEVDAPRVTEEDFARLVGRYRVSPDAMAWRLKSLGLIDSAQRADLGAMPIQQAALRGGWTEDYRDLTSTQGRTRPPLILVGHAVDAFVGGKISARPVATLLQIDSDTLLELHATTPPAPDNSSSEAADEAPVFTP